MLKKLTYAVPPLFLFACVAADSGSEADQTGAGGSGFVTGGSSGASAGTTGTAGASGSGKAGSATAGTSSGKAGGATAGQGGASGDPFGGGGQAGTDPFGGGGAAGANDCTFDFDPCDDGNPCTEDDECFDGICEGFTVFCPSTTDPCAKASCNPMTGACEDGKKADGTTCTDPKDLCVSGKTCMAGLCQGGMQKADGASCTDSSDLCTSGKTCKAGQCQGGSPKDCSFLAGDCDDAFCDPVSGCDTKPKADGAACDDSDGCTFNDVCSSGICSGTTAAPFQAFADAFTQDPSPWTAGAGWAIGAAKASTCDFSFGEDPSTDHTASTSDNRLAGTNLGGCVDANTVTSLSYLESPAIDASMVKPADPLFLSFWHKCSFDGVAQFKANAEVYDGTKWVEVWASKGGVDVTWTQETVDITKYKVAGLKVRFGWAQLKKTGTPYAGWNLDDVEVGVPACTP